MIQATELRIGNYILFTNVNGQTEWLQVNVYHMCDIVGNVKNISSDFHASRYLYIPLTHEILDKVGGRQKSTNEWKIGRLNIDLTSLSADLWTSQGLWYLSEVQYVHQLQNLYFTLTGQELKIEL